MQIPVLSGIAVDRDFRTEYPVNMIPVPKATGISEGYLAPAHGIVANGTGRDRGGIEWRGVLYRAIGENLCRVLADGTVEAIGAIGGEDRVRFTYGFDRLAMVSNGQLWYYDGATLAQVTDPDLGIARSVEWIDGYFLTTDGEFLVITELNDPFAVNPLKYGSSEADPDPVLNALRLRSEIYAINRHTIEVFANVGGTLFPFERIRGAQMQRGAVGRDAVAVIGDVLAFVGSGRGEAISIYAGQNGGTVKLATREIDEILATYSEAELAGTVLETMAENGHQFLISRLPRHTLAYDLAGSEAAQQPVWFRLSSTIDGNGAWKAQNLVWCYDRWNVGHPSRPDLGYLTRDVSSHWGQMVGWRFTTPVLYGESRGAVLHDLELVALTGRAAFGADPTIGAQYSIDGVEWSQTRWISAGRLGERTKRLSWRNQWRMRNWMVFRFMGTSDAPVSVARLEARVEALAY